MADRREYLGDEIHMMASDIAILRNENELLKMTSERKAEENRILKADLTELRAKHEEAVTEAAALRTVLEGAAQGIHHGLQRYLERRSLKKETMATAARVEPPPPPDTRGTTRARPLADEATRVMPPPARIPRAREDLPTDEAPAFLRQTHHNGPFVRNDIVDNRLPDMEIVSDDDRLRSMHATLGNKS